MGERKVGRRLHAGAARGQYEVLDDRRVPGGRANIDFVVVARSGVYVIDAKRYRGKIERRVTGFGRGRREFLVVNGRDRSHLAEAMEWQVDTVRLGLRDLESPNVDVVPVLCFVDGEWGLLAAPFSVAGVRVTWPRALVRALGREGPVSGTERARLARLLSVQLPAAVPSGG